MKGQSMLVGRPLRILHLNRKLVPDGGSSIYLIQLVGHLRHRGHSCTVVCARRDRAAGLEDEDVLELPEAFDFTFRRDSRAVESLRRFIQRQQPDLIHIHDLDNPYVVDLCAEHAPLVRSVHDYRPVCPGSIRYYRSKGTPCRVQYGPYCLISAYTNWCNSRSPARVVRSYLNVREEKRRRHRYVRVIVASRYVADLLAAEGFDRDRIMVLPYFVQDLEGFVPPDWEAKPRPPRLLFMGRVAEVKGVDRLLRAMTGVKTTCELLVAGDGYSLEHSRQLAARLGLEERVRFLGWLGPEERRQALVESYVLVVPSLWPEPFGIVGLEAAAAGLPAVAFDVGGISEWLVDGETGLLAKPGDVDHLARQIERVLRDEPLARRLGAAGKEQVRKRFGVDQHVQRLLEIYHGCVGSQAA